MTTKVKALAWSYRGEAVLLLIVLGVGGALIFGFFTSLYGTPRNASSDFYFAMGTMLIGGAPIYILPWWIGGKVLRSEGQKLTGATLLAVFNLLMPPIGTVLGVIQLTLIWMIRSENKGTRETLLVTLGGEVDRPRIRLD